jgi:integrase
MSNKAKSRIYWRDRGGERRAYADFRDVGGGREALIPDGETRAATDSVIAEKLVADRLVALRGEKQDSVLLGIKNRAKLGAFIADHLVKKAESGRFSSSWLADSERMLTLAVQHFGENRDPASVSVEDVQAWVRVLSARPSGRKLPGGTSATLGGGAVRHHLNVLSNVYRRAQSEGRVPPGFNPVASIMDKPSGKRQEARWLEVHDAALLLEAARTYKPTRADAALGFIYPLIATYLLTGGRETEVLGLEVGDVNFERMTVTFRPNEWRRLKTRTSHRTVPLWPQLATILRAHLRAGASPRVGGLLFPSPRLNGQGMVSDFRKAIDAVAERAGWRQGEDPFANVPSFLLCRAVADVGYRHAGIRVHCWPGAWPRR